jgi:hypothetical protein
MKFIYFNNNEKEAYGGKSTSFCRETEEHKDTKKNPAESSSDDIFDDKI